MSLAKVILTFTALLAGTVLLGACATGAKSGQRVSEAEVRSGERAEEIGGDSEVVLNGTLEGRSGHKMSGSVSVAKADSKYVVRFEEDFSFDGAPAPVVAFGRKGYLKDTQIGKLRQDKGRHSYEVPTGLNAEDYDEIWVWCTDYDVPLGTAGLTKR